MNKKKLIVEDDIGMQEELKDFVNAKEKRKESNIQNSNADSTST